LKDEFGGRNVRVRGHAKVMCHLMFGILALTADQFLRFVTYTSHRHKLTFFEYLEFQSE